MGLGIFQESPTDHLYQNLVLPGASLLEEPLSQQMVLKLNAKMNKFSNKRVEAKATYTQFQRQFSQSQKDCSWMGRKITAIPLALLSLIKAVGHAVMVLSVIPRSCIMHNFQDVRGQGFKVFRDLEEAAGYGVTLVNDRRGSFLVQRAQFYKDLYESLLQYNIHQL